MIVGQLLNLKRILLCLICVGLTSTVSCQKRLFKEWIAPSFSHLHIESDDISKITLQSESIDQISIYTRVEGESYDNSHITVAITEHELFIGTDFTPYFEPFNDKLAAHKVLAIEMIIVVPENLRITIQSTLANVHGTGHFNYVETDLGTGNVQFESFEGNATLFSKWGLIHVGALPGVSGSAQSVYGEVTNTLPQKGKYQIEAASTHGGIVLLQTKK